MERKELIKLYSEMMSISQPLWLADMKTEISESQHHADEVPILNAWLPILIHFGM